MLLIHGSNIGPNSRPKIEPYTRLNLDIWYPCAKNSDVPHLRGQGRGGRVLLADHYRRLEDESRRSDGQHGAQVQGVGYRRRHLARDSGHADRGTRPTGIPTRKLLIKRGDTWSRRPRSSGRATKYSIRSKVHGHRYKFAAIGEESSEITGAAGSDATMRCHRTPQQPHAGEVAVDAGRKITFGFACRKIVGKANATW